MMRLPALSPRFTILTVVLFAMAVTLISIGQTWWAIQQDRELSLNAEAHDGLVAVRLLDQLAIQELEAGEQRLDAIVASAFAINTGDDAEKSLHQLIEQSLANNRIGGAFQLVRPDGTRWVSTHDFPSYVFPKEPRDYIGYLLANRQHKKLVLGKPLLRSIDSELVLPIARNLYDHAGRYLGLVSSDVNLANLNSPYSSVAKNSQAMVELFANAGYVVLRFPYDAKAIKRDLQSTLNYDLHHGRDEGILFGQALVGQTSNQMVVYRKSSHYPITTVVSRNMSTVLAAWQRRTWDRIRFSAVLVAFQILLSSVILLQIRNMQRAQIRLKNSERSLQQSEAKFVGLFQHSPVPLALSSLKTERMLGANEALLKQFGWSQEQFIGHTPHELGIWFNPEERAPYLALLTRQGFVDRYEVHLRRSDGQLLICRVSSRIIEADGELVSVFSPIDITHEREVEQEIRDLNSELEQRVARRTLKLESALESVKKMQADLERMALTDELTGVPNRRRFLQQLEQEMARARRYGRPLCVAMLDLDHFKQVNDRFGHSGGDEVLKHFTAFVRSQLRENDMLGRLGGEEFAVMLPETELGAAFSTLNRIVRNLASETVTQVAPDFHYSFSCGLALFDQHQSEQHASALLANADHALYQAKANGRNQLVVFDNHA